MRHIRALLIFLFILEPVLAFAIPIFPDVSEGNPYQADIESLVQMGVVHGNPDGTFHPDRQVNRAEMLKMLYLATHRTPDAAVENCFPDVMKDSWYEPYVCDAAKTENRFVEGYGDGNFKPENGVNRVEALKMIYTVFALPTDASVETDDITSLVDIASSAWYVRYIATAFRDGILPIPGQSSAYFYPERALLRKEAAAMIASAMDAKGINNGVSSSSVASVSSTISSASSAPGSAGQSGASSSVAVDVQKPVKFPFTDAGQFMDRRTTSYTFTLKDPKTVMDIQAEITGAIASSLICRLYLFNDLGFTDEYYLGVTDGSRCSIRAALKSGNYQLQIQPTVDDAYFTVTTKSVDSDGSDGFMEAVKLARNVARTDRLLPHDVYDWYIFTVTQTTQGYIEVSSTSKVNCIIYTPPEVDQFGFEGPQCNAYYEYQPGTYTVGIAHEPPLAKEQSYTILFR